MRHQALARRILYGQWQGDLIAQLTLQVGVIRKDAWKCPDMTANPLRTIAQELSHTYDTQPVVIGDERTADELEGSGVWALMQRVDRDVKGLREMFLRADVIAGQLTYRPVPPHLVEATAPPATPDTPHKLKELRLRSVDGRPAWTWDVLDISGPTPAYMVQSGDGRADLSDLFLTDAEGNTGAMVGDRYPYRWTRDARAGDPYIPYNTRHAEKTGMLFDPFAWVEIVEGTLNVGVLRTFLTHVIRDASWAQRYTVDLQMVGKANVDGRQLVLGDPAVVAEMKTLPDAAGQPLVGQWQTTADPEKIEATIARYARVLPAIAGVNSANSQRVAGDPRSGFALAISRDDQREAQKRYEPNNQAADQELAAKSAAMMNAADGGTRAETGYRFAYKGIPLSVDERKAQLEEIKELRALKLISRVEAYQMRNPGTTVQQAATALAAVDAAEATPLPFAAPKDDDNG